MRFATQQDQQHLMYLFGQFTDDELASIQAAICRIVSNRSQKPNADIMSATRTKVNNTAVVSKFDGCCNTPINEVHK